MTKTIAHHGDGDAPVQRLVKERTPTNCNLTEKGLYLTFSDGKTFLYQPPFLGDKLRA